MAEVSDRREPVEITVTGSSERRWAVDVTRAGAEWREWAVVCGGETGGEGQSAVVRFDATAGETISLRPVAVAERNIASAFSAPANECGPNVALREGWGG